MADTSTFPSINPLDGGREGVTLNLVARGTIKAGQVVAFNATGVAKTVEACNGETTTHRLELLSMMQQPGSGCSRINRLGCYRLRRTWCRL